MTGWQLNPISYPNLILEYQQNREFLSTKYIKNTSLH